MKPPFSYSGNVDNSKACIKLSQFKEFLVVGSKYPSFLGFFWMLM